jgi:hypothetical protein
MNYRDRVAPLRVGGKDEFGRQRVASPLELAPEPVATPRTTAWVDWDAIPAACGFTRSQKAIWTACWRNAATSGCSLGMTRHEIGAANREILRKLRKNRAALHGLLGYLSESENISQEFWATAQNQRTLGLLSERANMTIAALTERKVAETAKLARIGERTHGARLAWQDAQGAVTRIETALRVEQEAAVLAEQDWPSPAAEKTLASARAKTASAESAYSAAQGAMSRQEQILEGVEGELFGRRMEIFETELAPAKENLFALMREFCEAACHVEQIAQRHGIGPHTLPMVLYPSADGFTGFSERNARCALINGALNLSNFLRTYYVGRTV